MVMWVNMPSYGFSRRDPLKIVNLFNYYHKEERKLKTRFAKILSIALVLIMALSVLPHAALARVTDGNGTTVLSGWFDRWWDRFFPRPDPTPSYPAQTMSYDAASGVSVYVDAPAGALPANTSLDVAQISNLTDVQAAFDHASDERGTVRSALDISFLNRNKDEVEPKANVTVIITDDIIASLDGFTLVHFKGSAEDLANGFVEMEVIEDCFVSGNTVTFEADDFSVYAVVDEDVVADESRLAVNFFGEDTVHPLLTVYVKQSENTEEMINKIFDIEPEVVTNSLTVNDLVFCGWIVGKKNYEVSDFIDGNHSIENVRTAIRNRLDREVAEGDVMNVYAMLFYEYSVKYVGEAQDGKNPVLEAVTLYSKDGSPVDYEIDLNYTPKNLSTSKFNGWVISGDTSNTVYNYNDVLTVSGDVVLMTDVSNGHWISFNEKPTDEYKGAKYVAPKFFETTESMDGYVAPESTLAGYHFDGWYTDANYTTEFSFTGKLNANVTLYAKWTMNANADVTVIIWQQDVEDSSDQSLTIADKKYNYVTSATVSNASTSSNVNRTLVNAYTQYDGRSNVTIGKDTFDFTGFHYEGFTYSNDKSGKVHPAGTTVVNVYYDRNYHTLTFKVPDGTYTRQSSQPSNTDMRDYEYYIDHSTYGYCEIYNIASGYLYYIIPRNKLNTSKTYYGFYNDEWTQVEYRSGYGWWFCDSSSWYAAVPDNAYIMLRTSSAPSYYYRANYKTIHTASALYGQDITDSWNFTGSDGVTYPRTNPVTSWQPVGNSTYTARITKQIVMPDTDITYNHKTTANTTRYFYYYVEALEGASNTVTYNGTQYVRKDYLPNDFNVVFYEDDFWNLRGFTRQTITDSNNTGVTIDTTGSSWEQNSNYSQISLSSGATANTLYFWYTRNQYKIHYMWGAFVDGNGNKLTAEKVGEIKSIDGIYFETNIDSYKVGGTNYFDPTRSLNNPAYVFEGWYKDPDCTVPFDFANMTMPANDIAVFAKFRTIQYRVFLRNVGESGTETYTVTFNDPNQSQNFRINYGAYISGGSPIEATRSDGMILAGWFLDEDCTQPFDFYQEINNSNTIVYDKTDPFNYTDPADGTTSPLAINKDVDRTWITRKLDLYAKWVAPLPNVDGINVVYDANMNGTITGTRQKDDTHEGGRYYTDPCLYSDGVTAFVRAASTPDNPDNTFDYWELLDKDGNVIGTYKPGQKFEIDADLMARLTNPAAGSKGAGSEAQRDSGTRSGSPIVVPTATSDKYQLVTSLESGGKYLITYTSGSTTYVVTYNEYSSTYGIVKSVAATPTTSGGYTTFSSDMSSYQYTVSGSDSNGWSFYNANNSSYPYFGTYYYSSDSTVYAAMNSSAQYWTYSNNQLYIVRSGYSNGNGTYYLFNYSSSSDYGNSVDVTSKVANAGTFRFYKLVEPSLNEALNVSGGTLEFTNDTTYPWTVVTGGNRIYAQSGNAGVNSSSSDVKLTLTMAAGDTLSFDYYVSSERDYDYFRFLVNGTTETSASGTSNTSWRSHTFTADTAGTYTFTWRFYKDRSGASGNDCARVDNIAYTATAPAATYQVSFLDKDGNVISDSTQTVTEGDKPTAPADPAAPNGKRFDGWTIQGGGETVFPSNDLPEITENTVFVAHFSNLPIAGWYFETSPSSEGWTFVDSDGDGHNWIWQEEYGTSTHCTAYEGEGLIYSESYYKAGSTALTPDNWAITPAVTLPTGYASVTLYAKGQDANYPAEHFAIYVGTSADISGMTKVSEEFVATGEYVKYEVDLTDYVGQTVYIAIRHYNVSDQFYLNIDQVEVWGEDAETPVTGGPYTVIFWDGYSDTQIGEAQTVNHGEAAIAPEIPVHEGYTFVGWSTTFNSVTSDLRVVANYRDNSANVDLNTMTILMRAHYTTKQYTFITWHANNGSGEYKDSDRVLINENIPIEFPEADPTVGDGAKPGDTVIAWPDGGELLWTDHIFLGWARVEIGNTTNGVGAEFDPTNNAYVKERSFNEDDLFLKYYYPTGSQTDGHFEAKINGAWTEVEFVAADEVDPYHGMYAVWADVFYVYHSGTNTVEKVVRTTKSGVYDLTASIDKNTFLYGGYYEEYKGVSTGYVSNQLGWDYKAAWKADGTLDFDAMCEDLPDSAAGAKAYNGSNVKWDVTKAYTVNGMAITPVAGATYYIKEVPAAKYLRPYLHYTYYTDPANHNPIGTAWLISDVDDLTYQQSGFVIVSGNNQATIVKSITVSTTTDPNNVEILTSAKLFGARGYLSYLTVINDGRNGEAVVNLLADNQSVAQYWVTPDGLMVTGTVSRVYTGLANKDNIACTPTTSASTISLFVAPTPAG